MDAQAGNKFYVGDGVYASNDGWHVILETERENGTNQIYLEPEMLSLVMEYAKSIGFISEEKKNG